jgi:hypothetical protein
MDSSIFRSLSRLSNDQLLAEVMRLAACEREATAGLIAHLAEVDARGLHLVEGCSSLFVYCTQVLHFSEHAAYGRIEAARAARRFPVLLERLARGEVNLTTVTLLGPVLTAENHRALLDEARHKSRRDVEEIVARVRPQACIATSVRKLPQRALPAPAPASTVASLAPDGAQRTGMNESETFASGASPAACATSASMYHDARTARRTVIEPLSPGCYRVQFTASAAIHAKLRRAQDLLRHRVPDGDVAAVFDRALDALLREIERSKFGVVSNASNPKPPGAKPGGANPGGAKPGSAKPGGANPGGAKPGGMKPGGSEGGVQQAGAGRGLGRGRRYIPPAVRRAVWARDGERCTFVGRDGRRCGERRFLEFDHAHPHADGGPATVENLRLRCRAHNQHTAEFYFGPTESIAREASAPYPLPRGSVPSLAREERHAGEEADAEGVVVEAVAEVALETPRQALPPRDCEPQAGAQAELAVVGIAAGEP